MQQYAPGMRLLIRSEEWITKKVDSNSDNGQTLTVVGISQLVKDQEARFLDSLEKIEEIKPEETELVFDDSPYFKKSKLYIESMLRRKAPTINNKLFIGHKAAMNTVAYQLEPSLMALKKTRQRVLISDAVGLGKSLEAGILMSELIRRGKGKRILVVTVKSMMLQFQKEMWNRFTIPLIRLDSNKIQKIRADIPTNHNPFYCYDKTIISMDTLKRDIEYRTYLENSYWDIIVIDEAHNVASRGSKTAQRSRLANLLSNKSDSLIMMSATPHDGKAKSFASIINMLDPTVIANDEEYAKEDISDLCIRRFKKDIKNQVEGVFKERCIYKETCEVSDREENILDYFVNIEFKSIDRRNISRQLFKTTLEKALFSSPAACISTINNRIKIIEKKGIAEQREDYNSLKGLKDLLEELPRNEFTRYQKLISILKSDNYGWNINNSKDRVVIFTERIETLKFLKTSLKDDLKLNENQIEILYGGMNDIDQQKVVDDFGRDKSPVRILVASDVASEGINLHYLSHRLIHFDIPWSLMVFQQRNGRIDRYGQEETPDIRYLVNKSKNQKINGDMRILEVLIEKEKQAEKNIGDVAAIMNVYDIEEEEALTAKAIETGDIEDFNKLLKVDEELDPLAMMLGEMKKPSKENPLNSVVENKYLYSELDYLEELLRLIPEKNEIDFEKFKDNQGISIKISANIKERLKKIIPDEAMSKDELNLTIAKEIIEREIKKSREEKSEKDAWPKFQYLWELHPFIDWVNNKASVIFKRKEAPVLSFPNILSSDESIFIVSALYPNRKSQPVISEWFGLKYKNDKFIEKISVEDIINKFELDKKRHPNSSQKDDILCDNLKTLLIDVVEKSKTFIEEEKENFENDIFPELEKELKNLDELKQKHIQQLSIFDTEEKAINKSIQERKKEEKRRSIDRSFDGFYKWIEDSIFLESKPYIQIIAVIVGGI